MPWFGGLISASLYDAGPVYTRAGREFGALLGSYLSIWNFGCYPAKGQERVSKGQVEVFFWSGVGKTVDRCFGIALRYSLRQNEKPTPSN